VEIKPEFAGLGDDELGVAATTAHLFDGRGGVSIGRYRIDCRADPAKCEAMSTPRSPRYSAPHARVDPNAVSDSGGTDDKHGS